MMVSHDAHLSLSLHPLRVGTSPLEEDGSFIFSNLLLLSFHCRSEASRVSL